MSLAFPAGLIPRSERWKRRLVTISGGVTIDGISGASLTDGGGLWVAEQVFIVRPHLIGEVEMFEERMESGSVSVNLPAFRYRAKYIAGAAVVAPAPLRATTLTVAISGFPFEADRHHFSIDHPTRGKRLYRVTGATLLADGLQTITFRPPLREAVSDELLDRTNPGCVMRMTNPDDFLTPVDLTQTATMSPTWVESF